MSKKTKEKPWIPRGPLIPPNKVHRDKAKYRRKPKHKKEEEDNCGTIIQD